MSNLLKGAILILFGCATAIAIVEIAFLCCCNSRERYYVWQPNLHHVFEPDSSILLGIRGRSNFTINKDGLRGSIFEKNAVNIVSIGGSTSECLYLDDIETWQHHLSKKNGWKIGSMGKSGCSLFENYLHLKYAVSELKHVDGILLMAGLNDMYKYLASVKQMDCKTIIQQPIADSVLSKTFYNNKNQTEKKWWKNTATLNAARKLLLNNKKISWTSVQDNKGEFYKYLRLKRSKALLIDSLPDMEKALQNFECLIFAFYEECKKQNLQLFLTTQPTIYKDTMPNFEKQLLWMGGRGNFIDSVSTIYYGSSALKKANEKYNSLIRNFAQKHHDVLLIDLAKLVPKDTTIFYDDCHFNELGCKKVASAIDQEINNQKLYISLVRKK